MGVANENLEGGQRFPILFRNVHNNTNEHEKREMIKLCVNYWYSLFLKVFLQTIATPFHIYFYLLTQLRNIFCLINIVHRYMDGSK